MKARWAALLSVLALSAFAPTLAAQSKQEGKRERTTGSELLQNYPNPFNPETTIPFKLGGYPDCTDPSRQYKVSLRVYNILAQVVAVPLLQGASATVPGGQPLENVLLTCGEYTAWWDGKYRSSGREVASGVYIVKLEIDGKPITMKMSVMK
jgi:hypothetical protein